MKETTQTNSALGGGLGGARAGSGRKKKEGRKVTFFLSNHAIELLRALSVHSGSGNMTAETERSIRDRAEVAGVTVEEITVGESVNGGRAPE